jgi:hypothetical protein
MTNLYKYNEPAPTPNYDYDRYGSWIAGIFIFLIVGLMIGVGVYYINKDDDDF